MWFIRVLVVFIISLGLTIPVAVKAEKSDSYLLHEGDVLDISVWGDPTLAKQLKVLPDGSISYPLVGRVLVAGQTSVDVERLITQKLKKYLPEPEVIVIVVSTAGSNIYVLGKVKKPGPIPLTGPLTVLQALSIAGGFDKFADEDSIKILHKTSGGYTILPVDYNSLLKGKELDSNYTLSPGDTVLVP